MSGPAWTPWLAVLAPLAVLALVLVRPSLGMLRIGVPAAPLGLLLVGLARPASDTGIEWLGLGVTLGMDDATMLLIAPAAVAWIAAGLLLRWEGLNHPLEVASGMMLALSGMAWALLARDVATFYAGFAIMTVSTALVVVAPDTPAARRAGRIYIAVTILGEVLLLAGLWLVLGGIGPQAAVADVQAQVAGNSAAALLIAAGLGTKVGALLLHVWMPIVYAGAHLAAAVALSAAMINVGVIGLVRLLPVGVEAMPWVGTAIAAWGALGVVAGVALGLTQLAPRAALAYSSVSQMGLMLAVLGVVLAHGPLPGAPAAGVVLAGFAAHHAAAKGLLIATAGIPIERRSRWTLPVAIVAALVLAGVPLTTGAQSKDQLAALLQGASDLPVGLLLGVGSLLTSALMAHVTWLLHAGRRISDEERPGEHNHAAAWVLLVGGMLLVAVLLAAALPGPGKLAEVLLPILAGVLLGSGISTRLQRRSRAAVPRGDLATYAPWATRVARRVRAGGMRLTSMREVRSRIRGAGIPGQLARGEERLATWSVAMFVMLALVVVVGGITWLGAAP